MQKKGKEQDYLGDNKNLINERINSVYYHRCKSEDLQQKMIIQKQLKKKKGDSVNLSQVGEFIL